MDVEMAKNRVLLTGAGFSRNWGGLLASEITNQLLSAINNGPPIVTAEYYKQLATETGNYETILQEFQRLHSPDPENAAILECLTYIEEAIRTCFFEMDRYYEGKSAGINNSAQYNVEVFMAHFDYLFTTNQDLLIERLFLNLLHGIIFRRTDKPIRNGTLLPGIRGNINIFHRGLSIQSPRDLLIDILDEPVDVARESLGFLPYIKLHGSYNWQTVSEGRLMISGGRKDQQINKSTLLKKYFEFFCDTIRRPNTLIIIIGYGFNDTHINNALLEAINNDNIQLFIIDNRGLDPLRSAGLIASLEGKLYGISERTLNETFLDINQAELLFEKLFHANN